MTKERRRGHKTTRDLKEEVNRQTLELRTTLNNPKSTQSTHPGGKNGIACELTVIAHGYKPFKLRE
jgi:hypothetical protein